MRVLTVFGTRPEAIKMAPVVEALRHELGSNAKVCVTAQHRAMLDQVLATFNIKPDFDLDLMREHQSLESLASSILFHLSKVLEKFKPDRVIVHGDTTTTFIATLAAYYKKIPVAHVEAGLRTGNIYSPWPEEANRRLTDVITDLHFAPTKSAEMNLLSEGIDQDKICVTGNTVVDALLRTMKYLNSSQNKFDKKFNFIDPTKNLILVTAHRRESFGKKMGNIFRAVEEIAKRGDVQVILPMHSNPEVRKSVNKVLTGQKNIFLTEPLEYLEFVYIMGRTKVILSDSGGIQEEAPSLGIPVLVMRTTTERLEAIESGVAKLVGTNTMNIVNETKRLLSDKLLYQTIANTKNPFGDGKASQRIVKKIMETKY